MDEKKGVFVCFEGIDGSGKSTQSRKFSEYLFSLNKLNHVVLTREPYKDVKIREIIAQDKEPLSKSGEIAELFVKDRRNHINELISPSLKNSWHIVCDRYKFSTICYQSAQGLEMKELIEMHEGFPVPDITFIIDLPAEVAIERMGGDSIRENKNEKFENIDFLSKTRENYLKMPKIFPEENIFIINSNRSMEETFNEIKEIFEREILNRESKKKKYSSMDEIPVKIKKKLEKYFSNVGGDIFAISGLPSELTGGALARYSRAPTGMQLTVVNEFLDDDGEPSQEKGSELMDRVLNAYGDDSVGELEGTHIGIENISQLLTKSLEDKRIGGSPIEQSTRYVRYDQKDKDGRWRYLRPKEIMESRFAGEYEKVNDEAFELYVELVTKLIDYFKIKLPEEEFSIEVEREHPSGEKIKLKVKKNELQGEAEEKAFRIAYNFTIRCASLDVGRCVLPSSTLTQVGIFGNGRFFSGLISSLKSGELEEEKTRGYDIECELKKVIPTFIKRNKENPRFKEINKLMRDSANKYFSGLIPEDERVNLIKPDNYLDNLTSSIIYPYVNISLNQILNVLRKLPETEKLNIISTYTGRRAERRDRTGRGLEAGYPLTFDIVSCFGEYRDLERHRMLTQQRQLLTTELGFVIPSEIREIGMSEKVEEIVKRFDELNKKIRKEGLIVPSQYVTLFNHRIRFMMGMNLREFQHLSELRTQLAGHYGYRSLVMEMADKVKDRYYWAEKAFQFIDYSDPDNKISRSREQSRIAGKNLSKGVDGSLDY